MMLVMVFLMAAALVDGLYIMTSRLDTLREALSIRELLLHNYLLRHSAVTYMREQLRGIDEKNIKEFYNIPEHKEFVKVSKKKQGLCLDLLGSEDGPLMTIYVLRDAYGKLSILQY